jgi:soluble lytic murein transglycosylase-like protein
MRDTVSFYFKSSMALLALLLYAGSAAADNIDPEVFPASAETSANPKSLVSLAARHEHAEGTPRDYIMAAALYCRAAKAGYADAQYALGWMYTNGRGVSKDDGVAAQLFAMAAAQGHVHASRMLNYTVPSSTAPLPACLLPDPPPVEAQQVQQEQPEDEHIYPKGPILTLVNKLAPRYNVDPKLALAIISVESGFNSRALSPKNAQGLMQLIPQTAERFRVKNPFDAEENIKGGLAYLQWLLAFFQGDVKLVVAAYNAGERAVERHRGIPPYQETRNYVQKVTALYKKSSHPFQHKAAPLAK